ncbi:MAG: hypothetical protein EP343_00615 [Deltaproteobacteria bacterium]|nr:MAG: hypothetical protein EP343_00615 [Deltaproteobacteria bacterium]
MKHPLSITALTLGMLMALFSFNTNAAPEQQGNTSVSVNKKGFCDPIIRRQKYNRLKKRLEKRISTLKEKNAKFRKKLLAELSQWKRKFEKRPRVQTWKKYWDKAPRHIHKFRNIKYEVFRELSIEMARKGDVTACFRLACASHGNRTYLRLGLKGMPDMAVADTDIPGWQFVNACVMWKNVPAGKQVLHLGGNIAGGNAGKLVKCQSMSIHATAFYH